jgi:hypothetical protein
VELCGRIALLEQAEVLGSEPSFVESQIGKLAAPAGRPERGFILGVEEGGVREKHEMKGFGRDDEEMGANKKRRRESGNRWRLAYGTRKPLATGTVGIGEKRLIGRKQLGAK